MDGKNKEGSLDLIIQKLNTASATPSPPPLEEESEPSETAGTVQKKDNSLEYFQAEIRRIQTYVRNQISKTKGEVKDLNTELTNTKDKVENQQKDIWTLLGIYVAFFTFLSINFQIFQLSKSIFEGISLTLILGGLLSLFSTLLCLFSGFRNVTKYFKGLILLTLCLIIGGLLILYISKYSLTRNLENLNLTKISPDFSNKETVFVYSGKNYDNDLLSLIGWEIMSNCNFRRNFLVYKNLEDYLNKKAPIIQYINSDTTLRVNSPKK